MTGGICSRGDCQRAHYAKDVCRRHYEEDLAARHFIGAEVGKTPAPALKCPHCTKPFKADRRRALRAAAGRTVFCSRECQKAGKRVNATCFVCGKPTPRPVSRNSNRAFCSRTCFHSVPTKERQGTEKPCSQCGTPVYRPAGWDKEHRFCSNSCKGAWLKGRPTVDRPESPCEQCGTAMSLTPDEVSHGKRFCSPKCAGLARRTPVGSRHTDKSGYVWIYVDKGGDKPARVLEHRWAIEQLLGRPLLPTETVHHLDGQRHHNETEGPLVLDERGRFRSGNLELWSHSQPKGQEIGPKLGFARGLLALYGTAEEQALYAEFAGVMLEHGEPVAGD